jgi:hypothetical protein
MADIRRDAVATVIKDIANEVVQESGRESVIQTGGNSVPSDVQPGTTVGGRRQTPTGVHGMVLSNTAFTNQPGAFNPRMLTARLNRTTDAGTPTAPRVGTGAPRYISGIKNDTMAVYLQWAPPLVDTNGRWLQSIVTDPRSGQTTASDLIDTYLITRECQGTGDIVVVGAVSHNEQYISEIRSLMEAAGTVTTSATTHVATFDPSVIVDGVVVPPEAQERFFYFTDLTAQFGKDYIYYIVAITQAQVESAALTIHPVAAQSEGTLDLQVGSSWVSSYPDLTSPEGTRSFADFAVITGGITQQVEIGLVPILTNAIPVDTTSDPADDPHVVSTNPSEAKLYRPTTGTLDNLLEFRGANMELAGGIQSISFGSGVTQKTPLSSNIIKTQVGTTDEWDYQCKVTVDTTAVIGPRTMTVTCVNGKTALCSTIKVDTHDPMGTEGATFDSDKYYDSVLTCSVVITGKNLDRIDTIEVRRTTGVLLGTATIVVKSANYLEFTYTLPGAGIYKIAATYKTPYVTTGKDSATLTIRATRDPFGDNGSTNGNTDSPVRSNQIWSL